MTTIIYDQNGRILMTQSGDMGVTEANVLTYEVPDGYWAVSVDPVTKKVTLEEIPKTEAEKQLADLQEKVAELEKIQNAQLGVE